MSWAKRVEDRERNNLPALITADVVLDEDSEPIRQVAPREAPPIPAELEGSLSDHLKSVWVKMWQTPVAQLWEPDSDVMVLSRLFRLYREDERLSRALDLHMDHFMEHLENDPDRAPEYATERSRFEIPIFMARMRVATECRMLEQQLGLTPKARLALGVALFVAGQSMSNHINAAMDPDG